MLIYLILLVPIVKHEFKVDNFITVSLARFVKQFEVMIVADNNKIHQYNINIVLEFIIHFLYYLRFLKVTTIKVFINSDLV